MVGFLETERRDEKTLSSKCFEINETVVIMRITGWTIDGDR